MDKRAFRDMILELDEQYKAGRPGMSSQHRFHLNVSKKWPKIKKTVEALLKAVPDEEFDPNNRIAIALEAIKDSDCPMSLFLVNGKAILKPVSASDETHLDLHWNHQFVGVYDKNVTRMQLVEDLAEFVHA